MTQTEPMKVKHARQYAQIQTVKESDSGNELVDTLQNWDRRMQRAFKGIVTRRARHRGMQRAGL